MENPLKFFVIPGQSSDFKKVSELIADATDFLGDKAYGSDVVSA